MATWPRLTAGGQTCRDSASDLVNGITRNDHGRFHACRHDAMPPRNLLWRVYTICRCTSVSAETPCACGAPLKAPLSCGADLWRGLCAKRPRTLRQQLPSRSTSLARCCARGTSDTKRAPNRLPGGILKELVHEHALRAQLTGMVFCEIMAGHFGALWCTESARAGPKPDGRGRARRTSPDGVRGDIAGIASRRGGTQAVPGANATPAKRHPRPSGRTSRLPTPKTAMSAAHMHDSEALPRPLQGTDEGRDRNDHGNASSRSHIHTHKCMAAPTFLSLPVIMKFFAFRSRWTKPWAWQHSTACDNGRERKGSVGGHMKQMPPRDDGTTNGSCILLQLVAPANQHGEKR